jgi:putative oxidoreductase|tara:strand:+ start:342842 stop:343270 length:429 start_codon:yes stop_codon:yes gene_type:complete
MENFLKRYEDHAYALLRMVTGFLFMFHGTNYILSWPMARGMADTVWYMAYIGMPILTFGGLFVLLGVFTRPAAFLGSGMMAVAYWMYYGSKAFNPPADSTNSFIELVLPIVNKGELSVMFCFSMLYIATRGSGIWSIDSARK